MHRPRVRSSSSQPSHLVVVVVLVLSRLGLFIELPPAASALAVVINFCPADSLAAPIYSRDDVRGRVRSNARKKPTFRSREKQTAFQLVTGQIDPSVDPKIHTRRNGTYKIDCNEATLHIRRT